MASTNIQRTLGQNSNSGKLTISVWVKRAGLGEQGICGSWYSGAFHGILYFNSNDQITFYDYRNSYIMQKVTTAQFRDVGAWYHIVCNFDHTLGSPTGKIYVNGVEQTLSTNVNYTQGAESSWLTDYSFNIGTYSGSGAYFNGNMSDFYFIQGYVYEASTFGETDATTGIWKPITEPTVNYSSTGNNSCHLKFENSSNMDLDSGDNNVSFTTSGNLTQTVDTPSNVFATLNPLDNPNQKGNYSTGNLTIDATSSLLGDAGTRATLGFSQGKWYWEAKVVTVAGTGNNNNFIGIQDAGSAGQTGSTNAYAFNLNDGALAHNGSAVTSGLTTYSSGNIIGVGYDADNGDLYLWTNGVAENSGNAVATGIDTTKTWQPYICCHYGANSAKWEANFGNGYFGTTAVSSAGSNGNGAIFEYDVPTGYYALNTKNINTYG